MKPEDRKKPHRATSEIPIILDERFYRDLEQTILKVQWPYKSVYKDIFVMRDRALVAFLIATGLRISEALAVKIEQFRDYPKKLVLFNVPTLKNGKVRKEIWITKQGSMEETTKFFINWYTLLKQNNQASYMFPSGCANGLVWKNHLSSSRAHWIIKTTTDLFPHWFRAVCETYMAKEIFDNDAYKLCGYMGLKRLDSTLPYVQAPYEKDLNRLYIR
jgi:site-specific recombinase XerD